MYLEPHIERLRSGKPLVSALLLQQHGIKPGKHMGRLLKEAEKLAVNEDLDSPEAVLSKLSSLPVWGEG